jgi:small subunit ribosomal protein S17
MSADSKRKELTGVVISDAMTKTITVQVDRLVKHLKYKKYIRRSTKYFVHDEKNDAGVGDTVSITETRPISKLKRWRLVNVVTRAAGSVDKDQVTKAGE